MIRRRFFRPKSIIITCLDINVLRVADLESPTGC